LPYPGSQRREGSERGKGNPKKKKKRKKIKAGDYWKNRQVIRKLAPVESLKKNCIENQAAR